MLKINIGNTILLTDISSDAKDWFVQNLTFDNPKYLEAAKHGRYVGNIEEFIFMYKSLPNGIIVPRGCLQTIEETILGKGANVSIKDNRILNSPVSVESNIQLRPYQLKAKIDLLKHPNGMLVAPAASGKTIMGLDIFASVRQKMLWLTHTDRLARQVIDRIVGTKDQPPVFPDVKREEIGFIGAGKMSIGERITIGMVPTLARREDMLLELGREFGLVIIDECHHLGAVTFTKVLSNFYSYYIYGLTATPYRRDKLEGVMFSAVGQANAVIERKEVKETKKIITPSLIKRVVSTTKWDGNDYNYILKNLIIPNQVRLSMIATDVVREAIKGNYCMVIGTRKAYCEALFNTINKYWAKTVIATGDYSRKHNNEQILKIENDEATVLVTTFELLGEGFDVPKLNRGFIALPFKEKSRVEQTVGRIQRSFPGKSDAIIYDYVDENIGILKNQWLHRSAVYKSLGINISKGDEL